MKFPFSKFTNNDKDFNSLISNLSCHETFSNVKECAEQCYYGEKNGVECVAFITFKTTEECNICNPATISEIRNTNNTQISDYPIDLVYILKSKKKKPVMYLPLGGDNITGTSAVEDGVHGTLISNENTQVQAGKVNQGLHVENRGNLVLRNTANKCLGNLSICTNGLAITLWINPSTLPGYSRHITHSEYSINIVATSSETIGAWTSGQSNSLKGFITQSVAPEGIWTHVAVVFDPDVGMLIYMNGILDAFKSIDEASPRLTSHGPKDYVFGSQANGGYQV